jgi:AraC-like DNA-binding protein
MTPKTRFPVSLHYVPSPGWRGASCTVLRAGQVVAAPDYRVSRLSHPGQDILYCQSGAGLVQTLGQSARIQAGELVWIANERPHAHTAAPRNPWTLLWVRLDVPDPSEIRKWLFGDRFPSISVGDPARLEEWFVRLFAAMRSRHPALDVRLHALVGELLSGVDQWRSKPAPELMPRGLRALSESIRGSLERRWSSADLAATAELSPSQVRRLFRKHLRTSPRRWLANERIVRAQGLLLHSDMRLAEIAEACGFCDVYHLGKEFKRSVGVPPGAWRRKET